MITQYLTRTSWAALVLLCLFLWSLQGCSRTRAPDEVFRDEILDPIPASITHLQGYYVPRREWFACLYFSASAEDLAKIIVALDAYEDKQPLFASAASEFADAPANLRPPKEWYGQCKVYAGLNSHGVASTIIAEPKTGEVCISMDHQ